MPRLTIFDLDGTLIEGHVERPDPSGPFVQVLDFLEVRVLPGRVETIDYLLDQPDQRVAVATNKAGVAFGHHTVDDCLHKRELVEAALNVDRGDRRFSWHECYTHPSAPPGPFRRDSIFRKPRPGMLFHAMLRHGVDPSETLMVGDMEADRGAAEAAGTAFAWAHEYWDEDPR